jgi:hypothetical protein
MNKFYLTRTEIYGKFGILICNIDKIIFVLTKKNEIIINVMQNDNVIFNISFKKHNGKLYREVITEVEDIKIKLPLSKFIDVIEDKFDNFIGILNFISLKSPEFEIDTINYEAGSKSRIKISKNIYVDINTEVEENCLLFLDSEKDLDYGYYTIFNLKSNEITKSSILDSEIVKLVNKYRNQLMELSMKQNKIKELMTWK